MDNDWENDYPSWDWKEKDWNRFLLLTESQVKRFVAIYNSLQDTPDRLDQVASRMGWTAQNWPLGDDNETMESEELPYTLHLHPVYTVTRGIFRSTYELCLAYARINSSQSFLQSLLLSALHEAETQAILGIESQDMGDMTLTVCHFKRSLSQLNYTLGVINRMREAKMEGIEAFGRELIRRIFDLREIWLRVNTEVREEIQRRGSDSTEE